jgi:hypothetical protein
MRSEDYEVFAAKIQQVMEKRQEENAKRKV